MLIKIYTDGEPMPIMGSLCKIGALGWSCTNKDSPDDDSDGIQAPDVPPTRIHPLCEDFGKTVTPLSNQWNKGQYCCEEWYQADAVMPVVWNYHTIWTAFKSKPSRWRLKRKCAHFEPVVARPEEHQLPMVKSGKNSAIPETVLIDSGKYRGLYGIFALQALAC